MVFKPVIDDITGATKSISIFNSTLSTMKRNIKNGQGFNYSIFSGNKLTQKDIESIISYSNALKKGTNLGKAWKDNMQDCSVAAKQYVRNTKKAGKSTDELVSGLKEVPKTSTAAAVGLNILKTAGNMLVMWGLSEVLSRVATGMDNIANSAKHAKEAAQGFTNSITSAQAEFAEGSSKIDELNKKYQNLSKGVNQVGENVSLTNTQYDEYKSVVKQISELMPNLTTQINSQGEAIGFVGGKLDSVSEKYKKYRKSQALVFMTDGDSEGKTYKDIVNAFNESAETEVGKKNFFERWISGIVAGFTNSSETEMSDQEAANILNELSKLSSKEDVLKFYSDKARQYNAFNDLVGYKLSEIFSMNDADFNKFRENMAKKSENYITTIEQTARQIGTAMSEYAFSTEDFWNMDGDEETNSKMQTYITTFLSGIDKSFLTENKLFTQESQQNFVSDFISYLSENKGGISEAFKELFSLNIDDMNVDDARTKIQQFCTIIAEQLKISLPDVQRLLGFGNFFETASKYDQVVAYASNGSYKSANNVKDTKGFNQKDVIDAMNKNGINTDEEIDKFKEILTTAESLEDAIKRYTGVSNDAANSTKSFQEAWDSIGTTGDDDAKKKAQEEKEKLEELAEAGKLTEKALKKSSLADTFKEAGVSIEEATEKINKMKSSADQLASMKAGISSISSILGQKKENQSSKKTRNKGISADTLVGMPEDVKAQTDEYEHFVEVLGKGSSTMRQCKDAANKLATAYVNSNNFLAKLTPETEKYYTSVLKEMGVENAAEVVKNTLTKQTYALRLEKLVNANASSEEIEALQKEAAQYGITATEMASYVLQKEISNNNALDTSESIENLIKLANQCGATGKVVVALRDLLKETSKLEDIENDNLSNYTASIQTDAQHAVDEAYNAKGNAHGKQAEKVSKLNRKLLKLLKEGKTALKVDVEPSSKSGSGSKKSKDSTKESKQTIDWIERRLNNLQSTIDLTSAKLQNLFSVKSKSKNLDKQIKTTTKLIKEYGIAANKYQKKADNIASGSGYKKTVKGKNGKKKKVKQKLSKSIIKKIQTGKLSKKTKLSSLVKAYGSDKAEQIQSYIDYYDKAQSAKKSQAEQITKKRELKQQKLQTYVDDYDAKATLAETRASNEVGFKKKNDYINKQITYLDKSYKKQIAIAKLSKDATEQARLQAEYEGKKVELRKQQIDNIKADYENKIGLIDNKAQDTQNQMSLIEAKGQIVTANYYKKQNTQETEKLRDLQNELAILKSNQNTFKQYSDEWYQLQADIQSVENSINDCNINIVENSKKLAELHDAMLDAIAANNSNMASEADFLASLMGSNLTDENSVGLTREGMGVLGTYGIGLESAENSANTYAKERKRLEKLLASGSYGRKNDEYQSIESLKEAIETAAKNQQDAIKTAYDYETKIADLMKESYQAQLDYMKKIIDAKKQVLSLEKDLYDYERNISNQTKNIATLEKQYAALQGDDSEEGRAKRSSLQASIDEARQELQDTEYDRYISDQQDMLDNLYTEYEDLMDNLFKDQNQLLQDGINTINDNQLAIKSTIDSYADSYGYDYTGNFSDIVDSLTGESSVVTAMRNALNGEDQGSIAKVLAAQADKIVEAYSIGPGSGGGTDKDKNGNTSTGFTVTKADGSTAQGQHSNEWTSGGSTVMDELAKKNAKAFLNDKDNLHKPKKAYDKLSDLNKAIYKRTKSKGQVLSDAKIKELADILGVKYDNAKKTGKLYQRLHSLGVDGFKHGGIGKLVKAKGEDGLAMVRNGEGFIAPEDVSKIQNLVSIVPDMTKFAANLTKLPSLPAPSQPVNTFGDIHFDSIELPNVQNVDDFVTALQTDTKVQHALEISVHDLMNTGKITSNIQRVR